MIKVNTIDVAITGSRDEIKNGVLEGKFIFSE